MGRRRGRYLGVLRGSDEVARNKLISYFKGEVDVEYPEKQQPRDDVRDIWIYPFNLGVDAGKALRQEINAARYSSIQSFINGFGFVTAPAVGAQMIIPGLLSDRAAITLSRQGTGTRKTSKLTGRKYLDYGGQAITVPFGRSGTIATAGPEGAFEVIYGRVKAASSRNLASYIPANYGVA